MRCTALGDLRDAGCIIVTITRQPSRRHHPVERRVKPEFVQFARSSKGCFAGVLADPG